MENGTKRVLLGLLAVATVYLAVVLSPGIPPTTEAQSQAEIVVDAAEVTGTIRPLQGINAGPRGGRGAHLFRQYRDLGVNYVRTHGYNGPADMDMLFPDLGANPEDEGSYDFAETDRELEAVGRVGADVLFRLGYSAGGPTATVTYIAPEDREVWAQAAVHVAMHYNDGWADGYEWEIEYWEVWNKPDTKVFWTGTPEEYFQLYETVARALKAYDPSLKVGGPAWCCNASFFDDFLHYCYQHEVPLDFVSWHYFGEPGTLIEGVQWVQRLLDKYRFAETENLLTEWNISADGEHEHLSDATGAAYSALVLSRLQDTSVAIANRYRADGELGMFDPAGFYRKPAYSFLAFEQLLATPQRLATDVPLTTDLAALAGRDEEGTTVQILISNYASSYVDLALTVNNLPWGAKQPYRYERYLLDEAHDLTLVEMMDIPAGSSAHATTLGAGFATTEAMPAPSVQLIRLSVPAGQPSTRITVQADHDLGTISSLVYGLNHRYVQNGYGVWDPVSQQVQPDVLTRSLQIGFRVSRFPGGTVGGTYHWTDGIGPPETRPLGTSGLTGAPATNEYGFDEQMQFMEQLDGTTNVVVNFGTGTEQEAAALVAYANGDPADLTPLGTDELGVNWGTVGAWAAQREANQARMGTTPHAYEIEYWEVGNELYGEWEYTWTHDPVKYALGGTAWQDDEPVVTADDWREEISYSAGVPSQVFYVRYPPVVTGTQTISVGGVVWTEVADLSSAGASHAVYEFAPQTGEIRFGDGVNGLIPPTGSQIRASYESGPHGGFVDYYAAMKSVDPDIKVGACHYGDEFLVTMGEEHPYDFLVVHLYSGSGEWNGGGLEEAHLRTMAEPLNQQTALEDLRARIQFAAGPRADQVEMAVTEYNLFVPEESTPTPHYGMSLDQGLFVADMVRVLVKDGIPLGGLHCLIDMGAGEGWANTPVMSPYPELLPRPGAYVLEMYNQHFADVLVESEVDGPPLLSGSLPALEVMASKDGAGRLTLLAVNKQVTGTISATVTISGFVPTPTATVWTLNGWGIAAYNDSEHPADVALGEPLLAQAGESFVYGFPAHSVTLLELWEMRRVYLPVVRRGQPTGR